MQVNSIESRNYVKPHKEQSKLSTHSQKTATIANRSFTSQKHNNKDPRTLTDSIKNASAHILIAILEERMEEFDVIHIGTFFHSLAKRINRMEHSKGFLYKNNPVLRQLCQFTEAKISKLDAPQISNVCWGCSEMHLDAYDLFKVIYEEILSDRDLLQAFTPQGIAVTLRAYTKENYECRRLFDAFAEDILSSRDRMNQFDAQSMAVILSAFADKHYFHKELFDGFANEIINDSDFCETFDSQHVAMIIRALAEIEYFHRDLFDIFANRIIDDPKFRQTFNPQGISMVLLGCADVQYFNQTLFNAFVEEILTNQDLREQFVLKSIAHVLKGYAELNYKHDTLLDKLLDTLSEATIHIINNPNRPAKSPGIAFAVILKSCADLYYQNQKLFDEIAKNIIENTQMRKKLNSITISLILFAYGLLNYKDRRIFDVFAKDLLSNSKLRQSFKCRQITLTLQAFVKVNYLHRELFDAFAKDILEHPDLTSFAEEMANILESYSLIKYEKNGLLKIFATTLLENPHLMQKFNSYDIMKILIPYSAVNYPHRELFEAFAQIILNDSELSEQFNSREIANTLRSYIMQNCVHPQLFQLLLDKLRPDNLEKIKKRQLLQVYWYLKKCLKEDLHLEWPQWFLNQRKNWQSLMRQKSRVTRSSLQKEVARDLKLINSHFKEEAWIKINIVDFLLPKEKLVVEVDGPHHFMENGEYRGKDILKQHLLEEMGFRVVRIPYQEWNLLKSLKAKKQYLERVIFNKFHKKIPISEKKVVLMEMPVEKIKEPEAEAPPQAADNIITLPKKRVRHKKIKAVAKKNLQPLQTPAKKYYTSQMSLLVSICAVAFMFLFNERLYFPQ